MISVVKETTQPTVVGNAFRLSVKSIKEIVRGGRLSGMLERTPQVMNQVGASIMIRRGGRSTNRGGRGTRTHVKGEGLL